MEAETSHALTYEEAARLADGYVGAYNRRDLDAMLALQDEDIVSYPSALFGHRPHLGHAGVRAWWQEMVDSGRGYQVVVSEVRLLGPDRFAALGEIHGEGQLLSPWGVVVRIRDGLIIESRSYLSDTELLEQLRLLEEPSTAD